MAETSFAWPSVVGCTRFITTGQAQRTSAGHGTRTSSVHALKNVFLKPNTAPETLSLMALDSEAKQYYREVRNQNGTVEAAPSDFFELLGVDIDAEASEVKAAYRALQRLVHPDIAGEEAHDIASFLNFAYSFLMDDALRAAYAAEVKLFRKEMGSFDGKPVSRWLGKEEEQRAVFVDETACVGCRNCTICAPQTFFIEDEFARARVMNQWGDDETAIRDAMSVCPVDCIYFIKRSQLALLEFILKSCKRESGVVLQGRRNLDGSPRKCDDPFVKAEVFLKHRREAQVELDDDLKSKHIVQTEHLAAALANAWFSLPEETRVKGWPALCPQGGVTFI